MSTLAETLRTARMQKGITQAAVAELCEISLLSFSRYERGQRVPPPHIVNRLSSILDSPAIMDAWQRDYVGDPLDAAEDDAPQTATAAEIVRTVNGLNDSGQAEALHAVRLLAQIPGFCRESDAEDSAGHRDPEDNQDGHPDI